MGKVRVGHIERKFRFEKSRSDNLTQVTETQGELK